MFTTKYANSQIMEFREAMGTNVNFLERLDKMFSTLFLVIARTSGEALGPLKGLEVMIILTAELRKRTREYFCVPAVTLVSLRCIINGIPTGRR